MIEEFTDLLGDIKYDIVEGNQPIAGIDHACVAFRLEKDADKHLENNYLRPGLASLGYFIRDTVNGRLVAKQYADLKVNDYEITVAPEDAFAPYPRGWQRELQVSRSPIFGTVIRIGDYNYTVIRAPGSKILLDRPLDAPVSFTTPAYGCYFAPARKGEAKIEFLRPSSPNIAHIVAMTRCYDFKILGDRLMLHVQYRLTS